MRIISGKFGGRKFYPPADQWPTRPTTDISKEGLYNTLQHDLDFESIKMLDLFGGTGNHCYECISRGCTDATYVDTHPPAVKFVKTLAQTLNIESLLQVFRMDVFKYIPWCDQQYDFIFAGPPYPLKTIPLIPDLIFQHDLLAPEGIFVLEHNPDHEFSQHPRFVKVKTYGQTRFSFFQ